MKQMTCAQMGGPTECTAVLTGSTAKEMIESGWKHIEVAHPDMAADIKNNSEEMNNKWMAEFSNTFDALPSMEEPPQGI